MISHVQQVLTNVEGEVLRAGYFSISTPPISGLSASGAESVALDTGAAANLACLKWLHSRNAALERFGIPIAQPNPACARIKFGNGPMKGARFAANVPAANADRRITPATSLVGSDIPALSSEGACESLERGIGAPSEFFTPGDGVCALERGIRRATAS